jgi:hypothetical protein
LDVSDEVTDDIYLIVFGFVFVFAVATLNDYLLLIGLFKKLSFMKDFRTAKEVYEGMIVDILFKLGIPVIYIILSS